MASYVNLFRGRYSSDKSTSDAERTESTPSPDVEAIELAPVVKKPEQVELKEITRVKKSNSSEERDGGENEIEEDREERVFHELTVRRSSSSRHSHEAMGHSACPELQQLDQMQESDKEGLTDEAGFSDPEVSGSETSSTDSDEGFDHIQNPMPSFTQILYSKDHVAMFPQKNSKLSGRLSVIKQHSVLFVTWCPGSSGSARSPYSIPPIPLSEIRAVTRHTPALGWHYVIIVLTSGCTFPPLYFNNGGVRSLLSTLKQHANLVKAINDPNTYLVNESPDPLKRSLHSLELDDLIMGGLGVEDCTFDHSLLSGTISKLKQLALGTTSNLFQTDPKKEEMPGSPFQDNPEDRFRPHATTPCIDIPAAATGEEASLRTEVGSFELLDVLVSRPSERFESIKRQEDWGKEVSLSELRSFFDSSGVMTQESSFRKRAFYGGLSPEARQEGWKYLFGLWDVSWSRKQCEQISREKQESYQAILSQWETISPEQERRFAKWRDRKSKIDKDVRRTDRMVHFFRHEHGEALAALRRILLSYVMYNFDLGYCQGMSDLASPILYVLSNGIHPKDIARWKRAEAEAFWCFSGMMDRVEKNFHTDQRGMHSQLLALEKLLQLLDPQLYAHFKQNECLNFFFCFRWVLILFKREFSFTQVLRLWEAFFSGHRTPHFHLYVCIAVLVTHRNTILQEDMNFDELLKFSCDLSGKLDLMPTLKLATVLSAWAEPIESDCLADIMF